MLRASRMRRKTEQLLVACLLPAGKNKPDPFPCRQLYQKADYMLRFAVLFCGALYILLAAHTRCAQCKCTPFLPYLIRLCA